VKRICAFILCTSSTYIIYFSRTYTDGDDLYLFVKNTNAIKIEALSEATKEGCLEVNAERKLSIWLCLITRMQDKAIIY
jgi:hypothetical protein